MKRNVTNSHARAEVDWADAFLSAFEETGVITRACEIVGKTRKAVWERRKNDETFAQRFEDSSKTAATMLEDEAVRRAREGVRRIQFNTRTGLPFTDPATGQPYIEHEYSDMLLLALLRRHFPQYRDKPQETHVTTNITNVVPVERQKQLQDRVKAARERRKTGIKG